MTSVHDDDLWVSEQSRFGTVRAVVRTAGYAFAFDDLNSDYNEVTLEVYRRTSAGWISLAYLDDVTYPESGETTGPGWSAGIWWLIGRDEPGTAVVVAQLGTDHDVEVDDLGWWAYVIAGDPPEHPGGDEPRVTRRRRPK